MARRPGQRRRVRGPRFGQKAEGMAAPGVVGAALRACIASTNPVKIGAVQQALAACFPDRVVEAEGCNVPSGVADQPMSDDETKRGAMNRFPVCERVCATLPIYLVMPQRQ